MVQQAGDKEKLRVQRVQKVIEIKGIILYCRKYKMPETLMASLKAKCPDAGTVKCFECKDTGLKVVGKIW